MGPTLSAAVEPLTRQSHTTALIHSVAESLLSASTALAVISHESSSSDGILALLGLSTGSGDKSVKKDQDEIYIYIIIRNVK